MKHIPTESVTLKREWVDGGEFGPQEMVRIEVLRVGPEGVEFVCTHELPALVFDALEAMIRGAC